MKAFRHFIERWRSFRDKHIALFPNADGTWRPETIDDRKLEWLKKADGIVSVKSPDELRRHIEKL